MALHATLTGADLHEPKGVAAASANTVYVANGSGSGTWSKVGASSVETGTVKNLNKEQMFGAYTDIGTAGSRYLGFAKPVKVDKIVAVIQSATSGADTVLTFKNNSGLTMGTITVPNGAPAGALYALSPTINNDFLTETRIQIDSDGGTSTNTNVQFTFELTWT